MDVFRIEGGGKVYTMLASKVYTLDFREGELILKSPLTKSELKCIYISGPIEDSIINVQRGHD
jgi:hypothetical protein